MACDSKTLETLLSVDALPELSDRDRLICLASVYGTAASLTAQTALNLAYTNGLSKLSDRDLDDVLASVLCGSATTTVTVFDENVEWSFISSSLNLNPADTSTPFTGVIDLAGSFVPTGDSWQWSSPINEDLSTFTNLILHLNPGNWGASGTLTLQWQNASGTSIGTSVTISNGAFGFDRTVHSYQTLTIPLANFAVPQGSLAKFLKVTVTVTGTLGFFMDTVSLA